MSRVRVVELALESGGVCLAERADLDMRRGRCVLLHEIGADMDRMRELVAPLHRFGLETLLLDLPGHGLSRGSIERDGRAAVESALLYAQDGDIPVAVVAEGRAADLLFGCHPLGAVAAYGLLSPRSDLTDARFAASGWQTLPSLSVLDPHDAQADRVAAVVARCSRATAGRVFAHKAAVLTGGRPAWPLQAGESIAGFMAEHLAFWRAARSSTRKAPA